MLRRQLIRFVRLSSLAIPAAILFASCVVRDERPAQGSGKPCERSRECDDDVPCTLDR